MNYITTYSYRFDKFLIRLVNDIRKHCTHELILGVNGNYKQDFDESYRSKILLLSTKYKKVFPFIYPNFRSLAKIWNNIVVNASNEYILILNDDVSIESSNFFNIIRTNIDRYQTSFKVDGQFCCFVIKKSELYDVGWFDERFLGIGWEDIDFSNRYLEIFKRIFLDVSSEKTIKSYVDCENVLINQKISSKKYSYFNEDLMYNSPRSFVMQYPHEKFYWENKEKL